jgi:hypothetical protein
VLVEVATKYLKTNALKYTYMLKAKFKSQTSTEYLIILTVVIVIALVAINNMSGFPSIGANSVKKVSELKLQTDTVGIESYSIGANSSLFKLKNNYFDTITVTQFRVNQQSNLTCNSSNTIPALPIVLNVGQSMIINCSIVNSSSYTITTRQTPIVGISYTDNLGATRTAGNVQTYNAVNSSGSVSISTYSVTYNGNSNTGGSVPVDSNNYTTGSTVIVLGNTGSLVKTGYTVTNWNTLANGTGTNYSISSSSFLMGSSNVTLYANWVVNPVICNSTCVALRQGLVGYWPLNENTSDMSGNGNNGVLTNSPSLVAGKVGQGYLFNGINQTIIASDSALPHGSSSRSMAFWFKMLEDNNNDATMTIASYGSANSCSNNVALFYEGRAWAPEYPQLRMDTWCGNYNSGFNIYVDNWYYVVFTYDGSNAQYYVNGNHSSLFNYYGLNTAIRELRIGGHNAGTAAPDGSKDYKGTVDEVAVWNRVLSETEVLQMYNGGNGFSLVQ